MSRPGLDPELTDLLAGMPLVDRMTPEILDQIRQLPSTDLNALLAGRQVEQRELTLNLTAFAPTGIGPGAPCIYWMHGGGRVLGDRFSQIDIPLEWLVRMLAG